MKTLTTTVTITAPERYAFLDLTDDLARAVKDAGVTEGVRVVVLRAHDLRPADQRVGGRRADDFRARLDRWCHDDVYYAHDDLERRTQNLQETHERQNGRSHVKAMLLSADLARHPGRGGRAHASAGGSG